MPTIHQSYRSRRRYDKFCCLIYFSVNRGKVNMAGSAAGDTKVNISRTRCHRSALRVMIRHSTCWFPKSHTTTVISKLFFWLVTIFVGTHTAIFQVNLGKLVAALVGIQPVQLAEIAPARQTCRTLQLCYIVAPAVPCYSLDGVSDTLKWLT